MLLFLVSAAISAAARPSLLTATAAAPAASSVRHANAKGAPHPDEATIAEAMRYLDLVEFEKNALRSTELTLGASFAAMADALHKRFGDKVPEDLLEQMRITVHDHALTAMRADLPDLKRQTAIIYATEFTKAELVRLEELQSDPVAIKAHERAKEMQPKLMMIGMNAMRAAQPELDAKLEKIVTDYVAAHGGAPSGSSPS
ncbi:hypothetical protein ACUXST_001557 [Sphingomonas sp. F9_3S_D5_B_2]